MTSIKLPPTTSEPWLAALDSGNYQQTTGRLYDGAGYCCLGVFAKVQGCSFVQSEPEEEEDDDGNVVIVESETWYPVAADGHAANEDELLQEGYASEFGIATRHQTLFASLNDGSSYTTHEADLMAIAKAIVENGGGRMDVAAGSPSFVFRKHSFAEISAIIKKYFT